MNGFSHLTRIALLMSAMLTGCAAEYPIRAGTETGVIHLTRRWDAAQECARLTSHPRAIACAVYNGLSCEIIADPDATNDSLGHELRHCFDGAWHR